MRVTREDLTAQSLRDNATSGQYLAMFEEDPSDEVPVRYPRYQSCGGGGERCACVARNAAWCLFASVKRIARRDLISALSDDTGCAAYVSRTCRSGSSFS